MEIRDIFLQLTQKTYPRGTEYQLKEFLPSDAQVDDMGNFTVEIGSGNTHAFTSHLDTYGGGQKDIIHVFDGDLVKTDGNSILGADDKAGVSIMLWLIDLRFPGIYYFFVGEESGCVGSKWASRKHEGLQIPGLNKIISLDRRGYNSVITHQTGKRTASDEFSYSLATEINKHGLNYTLDSRGFSTDSLQFSHIYPECCNLSVGYENEHTHREFQNLKHLEKLAYSLSSVDYSKLKVSRDPRTKEYRSPVNYLNSPKKDEIVFDKTWTQHNEPVERKFWDRDFSFYSTITSDPYTKQVTGAKLSAYRIEHERGLISNLLERIDYRYDSISWDGVDLLLKINNYRTRTLNRSKLSEFLPQLNFWC